MGVLCVYKKLGDGGLFVHKEAVQLTKGASRTSFSGPIGSKKATTRSVGIEFQPHWRQLLMQSLKDVHHKALQYTVLAQDCSPWSKQIPSARYRPTGLHSYQYYVHQRKINPRPTHSQL